MAVNSSFPPSSHESRVPPDITCNHDNTVTISFALSSQRVKELFAPFINVSVTHALTLGNSCWRERIRCVLHCKARHGPLMHEIFAVYGLLAIVPPCSESRQQRFWYSFCSLFWMRINDRSMNSKVAVILPLLFSVSRILVEADVYRTSSDNNWHILSLLDCLTCLITWQQIQPVWCFCLDFLRFLCDLLWSLEGWRENTSFKWRDKTSYWKL